MLYSVDEDEDSVPDLHIDNYIMRITVSFEAITGNVQVLAFWW